jgi:hypothetical protein
MPQYGRPSADTLNEGWTEDDGTNTTLFDQIDEASADDADYVQSALAPSNDPYVFKPSGVEDPQSSTGHIVRYRYGKSAAGGAQIDITVQLRQGYVSEASPGTLIAQWTHTNVSESWTTAAQTLSAGEANSITDYTDLYIRIVANQV